MKFIVIHTEGLHVLLTNSIPEASAQKHKYLFKYQRKYFVISFNTLKHNNNSNSTDFNQ